MRILVLVCLVVLLSSNQTLALEAMVDGKSVDVPVCGGIAGLVCSDDKWCDYPDQSICGGFDQFGVCRPRPEVCTKVYIPVCGCNDQTYGNACMAAMDGFDVAYAGPCRQDPMKK